MVRCIHHLIVPLVTFCLATADELTHENIETFCVYPLLQKLGKIESYFSAINETLRFIDEAVGRLQSSSNSMMQQSQGDISQPQCALASKEHLQTLLMQIFLGFEFASCSAVPLRISGLYRIAPFSDHNQVIEVYCEQKYAGGGWIVIQRNGYGNESFIRSWIDYRDGFGDLSADFWLGLEVLHRLTQNKNYQLLVLLEDPQGKQTYARYGSFRIGSEHDHYPLWKISDYSGTAGNALAESTGRKFTTFDSDNDNLATDNCARKYGGYGWWYEHCGLCCLSCTPKKWETVDGGSQSIATTTMMIKRA